MFLSETIKATVYYFTFSSKEINKFGLESERFDYIENQIKTELINRSESINNGYMVVTPDLSYFEYDETIDVSFIVPD